MSTFLRQYAAYGLGVALTRLAALLLLPLYTRYLSPSDYGALDTLMTLTTLLSPIFLLGGGDMGVQILFFKLEEKQQRDDLVISAILSIAGFAGICAVVGALAAPYLVNFLFKSEEYVPALRFLLADLWLITLLKLFLDNIRLHQQPLLYNAMTLSQIFIVTTANILFVVIWGQGVSGYVTGLLVGDLIITVIAGTLVLSRHRCRPTFSAVPALVRIGIPLLPVSGAYWVINLSNRFFLTQFTTLAEIGLYGIANRLATGFSIFSVAIQLGWRPYALSIQTKASARSLYSSILLYYWACVGGLGLLMCSVTPWLLPVITTKNFAGAAAYVVPLTLAQVMYGAYFIFSTGIEIRQKTYHLTWIVLLAAALSFIGNSLFIPYWGALAAAAVLAFAYTFASLLVGLVGQRVYPLPNDNRRLFLVIAWLLVSYASMTSLLQGTLSTTNRNVIIVLIISMSILALIMRSEVALTARVVRGYLSRIAVVRHVDI